MQLQGGGSTSVESTQIVDNTIVNDDINEDANIAVSKLNFSTDFVNSQLDESVGRNAIVTITADEIKALHTTPKVLIAAPGAGKIIVVENVALSLDAGTQYANGDQLNIRYDTVAVNLTSPIASTFVTSAADVIILRFAGSSSTANDVTLTGGANKNVQIATNTATAYITGTGTINLSIKYRILSI
jgi:hypothetical protein